MIQLATQLTSRIQSRELPCSIGVARWKNRYHWQLLARLYRFQELLHLFTLIGPVSNERDDFILIDELANRLSV